MAGNESLDLSGLIRANRFSIRTRIANMLCESILASIFLFLRVDLPKKGIAARTGHESREFQCESERRRDSRESGQVLQKLASFANRFARICERWCANRLPTKVLTLRPLG